ncbi:MAG: hypothetical protein KTR26_16510 [Flammeovirgaceae bacterium]|nr:hypothetical protein [Flammeovirgaceae bacterium]
MKKRNIFLVFTSVIHLLFPIIVVGQQVSSVPDAFKALKTEPEVFIIKNKMAVPTKSGHFQGVQLIEQNGRKKLLISGSSLSKAYLLQVDLVSNRSEKIIVLMEEPFRHAGGIQVSDSFLAVGIEDNFAKTTSKVCLYDYHNKNLEKSIPTIKINRAGEEKRHTAGALGLLKLDNEFLAVVGNWDSRNWDFYWIDPEQDRQELFYSFEAPEDWGSYQSINLIKDQDSIYAIGFYQKKDIGLGYVDLILVSRIGRFEAIMEKINSKTFFCKNKVDFSSAAGLQVDKKGKLHIWSTQKYSNKKIAINRFSQP